MTRKDALLYLNHMAQACIGAYPNAAEAIATISMTGDDANQILAESTAEELLNAVARRCDSMVAVMSLPSKNQDVTQFFSGNYFTILGMLQNASIDAQVEINRRKV